METTHEDTAATHRAAPHVTAHVAASPSLWRSVIQAFRQAQVARLEARLQRLRQCGSCASMPHEQPVMLMAAEQMRSENGAWVPMTTSRSRRRWVLVVTMALITVTGMSLGLVLFRTRMMMADATAALPDAPITTIVHETRDLRALLTQLDERVMMLQHHVLQHGEHLTTQAATMLRANQQADIQQTQVTALADTLVALTSQVAYVEQQVTTAATRLAAHEQQLATQATQLGPLRAQTRDVGRVRPTATVHASRPGPPTLEVLAPLSSQTAPPVPAVSLPPSPTAVSPARRSITLPAALGATGFHTTTRTPGGPQP